MARLLLALLIALLPMPAAAAAPACHGAPPAVAESRHHRPAKHEPAPLPADRLCMGCVAPATAQPPAFAAPRLSVRAEPSPARIAGEVRGAAPPAVPPPRSEA